MEKYLKTTDLSDSSDASVEHSTFNLTSLADGLSRYPPAGNPVDPGISSKRMENETKNTDEKDGEITNTSSSAVSISNSLSANKAESRRSSIPVSSLTFSRRSVGSEQPSKLNADIDHSASSVTTTCDFSYRTTKENGVKPEEFNPKSLNQSQNGEKNFPTSSSLPRTSPARRNVSSSLIQRVRNSGQQQQDRHSNSPEKKPPFNNVMSASQTYCCVENHADLSGQNTKPPLEPGCGEFKPEVLFKTVYMQQFFKFENPIKISSLVVTIMSNEQKV